MVVRDPRILPALVLLAALLLVGCSGTTEPATNVSYDNAQFHGQGTTGPNGTFVFFQWWAASQPQYVHTSEGANIGPKVTGPFAEYPRKELPLLRPATTYDYRLCGAESGTTTCAQIRSVTTATPTDDRVSGTMSTDSEYTNLIQVGARTDADGANPSGAFRVPLDPLQRGTDAHFSGNVTCMKVKGHQAVLGAVGDANGTPSVALLEIGTADDDATFDYQLTSSTSPPNCTGRAYGATKPSYLDALWVWDSP